MRIRQKIEEDEEDDEEVGVLCVLVSILRRAIQPLPHS